MKYLQFPFINSPFPDYSAMDSGTPPQTVRHSRPPAIPPLTPSQFLIPSGVYALRNWLACHLQRHNMITIYQSVSALPAPSSVHCPCNILLSQYHSNQYFNNNNNLLYCTDISDAARDAGAAAIRWFRWSLHVCSIALENLGVLSATIRQLLSNLERGWMTFREKAAKPVICFRDARSFGWYSALTLFCCMTVRQVVTDC